MTQDDVEGQLEFEEYLRTLKPLVRRLTYVECDYILARYGDTENLHQRKPYRPGWMKEVKYNHRDEKFILAAYLKKNPPEEDTKKKGRK